MKTNGGLTYWQIASVAVLTELMLITIQIVYMNLSGEKNGFTSEYMTTRGFYIFQIPGFFIYATVMFFMSPKLTEKVLNKVLLFVVAGGIVEIAFFLIVQADYQGVFLYSVLDKLFGAVAGLVLSGYRPGKVREPESYF